MSRIHSNVPALRAVHRLQRNHEDLNLHLNRLATGLRINRGADDPAGLIVSERLRSEIRTIQQAIDNSTRASNVISVAEGALNEVSALLLDLQGLIVETANEAGLTDEEVNANQLQIDSILGSLDRIANTTTFAGRKLLDGSQAFLTSGAPRAAFQSIQLFGARLQVGSARRISVQVTQSAQTAQVSFNGSNLAGPSTTSATTVEIRGTLGAELLTFAADTSLGQIRAAINSVIAVTGVSAVVSTPSAAGVASALLLNSTTVGSDAFVSVEPLSGAFIVAGNNGIVHRDTGVDAGVSVDGQPALVQGLQADARSSGLDARFHLTRTFAQTLSSATFAITGGGALFQLTPEVTSHGQVNFGFNPVSITHLGNPVTGLMYTLRSGNPNDLKSRNYFTAQQIVNEAIDQVSFYRGRLGNVQRNQIEPNINSQKVTLENVTASESIIRDADMAVEVSALTRARILVQSTQSTLQVANSVPSMVLSLLR